jgi:hypothetical protein
MNTVQKIQKVRAHDQEVRRKYDLQKNSRQKLIPFRKFRLQKKSGLKEAVVAEDIVDSASLFLPYGSDAAELNLAASELATRIVQMASVGHVSVIAISTNSVSTD